MARVRAKLASEPVEDLRVDFEDGYVGRSDADEDADVVRAARALAESQQARHRRAVRRHPDQVLRGRDPGPGRPHADVVRRDAAGQRGQPRRLGGDPAEGDARRPGRGDGGGLRDARAGPRAGPGRPPVRGPGRDAAVDPRPGRHGAGRADGARRGSAPDRAALRHLRLLGVLRDRRRAPVAGAPGRRPREAGHAGGGRRHRRSAQRRLDERPARSVDTDDIVAAWANHHRLVRRSLERGFYQGWDLHPAQLPTRFAATYAFYREALPDALQRLAAYTQHTSHGIADEPATARALASYLLRGVQSGAVDEAEVLAGVGLGTDQLFSLTFSRPRST